MFDLENQTLLVLAPHPDDEVLGCGGLIKRIKDEGGKVFVIFLTVGVTVEYSKKRISTESERLEEIERVAEYLKYDDYRIVFLGEDYHLKLDQVPQKHIMGEIENGKPISLNAIKPTIVATPLHADYNQDHIACTQAVLAATRPAPDDTKPLQPFVLGYESVPTADWWSTTENNANVFVTLSDEVLQAKSHAMTLYETQLREGAHPRSLQSMMTLAYYRGMHAGVKAAEAFFCYRCVL